MHPDKTRFREQAVPMGPYTARPVAVVAPNFQRNFNSALDASGFGVRSLAKATGVDKDTISAWRRGTRPSIQVEAVEKVAAHLGVSAAALLDLPPLAVPSTALATPPAPKPPPERALVRQLAALADELRATSQNSAPALLDVLQKAERIASAARSLTGPGDSG